MKISYWLETYMIFLGQLERILEVNFKQKTHPKVSGCVSIELINLNTTVKPVL